MLTVTPAQPDQAPEMSQILARILEAWGSDRPRSAAHVHDFYIAHPDGIRCSVACDSAGQVLGFQVLKRAGPANPYDLPVGWGIIGTYVSLEAPRQGIGSALFAATKAAAQQAGLRTIDATIGAQNATGLAYYEAMGFRSYRSLPGAIGKKYDVPSAG